MIHGIAVLLLLPAMVICQITEFDQNVLDLSPVLFHKFDEALYGLVNAHTPDVYDNFDTFNADLWLQSESPGPCTFRDGNAISSEGCMMYSRSKFTYRRFVMASLLRCSNTATGSFQFSILERNAPAAEFFSFNITVLPDRNTLSLPSASNSFPGSCSSGILIGIELRRAMPYPDHDFLDVNILRWDIESGSWTSMAMLSTDDNIPRDRALPFAVEVSGDVGLDTMFLDPNFYFHTYSSLPIQNLLVHSGLNVDSSPYITGTETTFTRYPPFYRCSATTLTSKACLSSDQTDPLLLLPGITYYFEIVSNTDNPYPPFRLLLSSVTLPNVTFEFEPVSTAITGRLKFEVMIDHIESDLVHFNLVQLPNYAASSIFDIAFSKSEDLESFPPLTDYIPLSPDGVLYGPMNFRDSRPLRGKALDFISSTAPAPYSTLPIADFGSNLRLDVAPVYTIIFTFYSEDLERSFTVLSFGSNLIISKQSAELVFSYQNSVHVSCSIDANRWYFVTLVKSSTTFQFLLNSASCGAITILSPAQSLSISRLLVGASNSETSQMGAHMRFDDFIIYEFALSVDQIKQLYTSFLTDEEIPHTTSSHVLSTSATSTTSTTTSSSSISLSTSSQITSPAVFSSTIYSPAFTSQSSECVGPPPSPSFTCVLGVWQSASEVIINSTELVFSGVIEIRGSLIVTQANLTIPDNLKINGSMFMDSSTTISINSGSGLVQVHGNATFGGLLYINNGKTSGSIVVFSYDGRTGEFDEVKTNSNCVDAVPKYQQNQLIVIFRTKPSCEEQISEPVFYLLVVGIPALVVLTAIVVAILLVGTEVLLQYSNVNFADD